MAKDVRIKVGITNNIIPVKVSIGQTVERIVGPEKYTPAPITPTEEQQTIPTKDKQLTDNVVVGPIPSEYIIPTGNIEITENGQYDVTKKASVSVDVRNEDYDNALPALGVTDRLTDGINALTTYSNGVTGKADTTLSDAVHTLGSGYGSGKKVQGTFVGNNSNKIDIPCEFEPSVIFIYANNDSVEFGGLYLICIIKDRFAILGVDSDRSMVKRLQYISYDITGYNDPPVVEGGVTTRAAQASYSDGVLTVGAVSHSSGWYEFKSEVTFEYILVN